MHSSQHISEALVNKDDLAKSQDFTSKKLLRVPSIGLQIKEPAREKDKAKSSVKSKDALQIEKPEDTKKRGTHGPSESSKGMKKVLKTFEFGLIKEKTKRVRRKIPSEAEDAIDIEEPPRKAPDKSDWARVNQEVYSPKIPAKTVPNVPSIDPKKAANEHPKPRSMYPNDGELSFKNKDEGATGASRKPSNFSFEGGNTTFGELGREQGKSVFKKHELAQSKSERDRENKEILNKMRQPITIKPERENAMQNTQQGSENSSNLRDEDDEDFPFDAFGF